MAGLAATIGADSPAPATAVADALAARGADMASWWAGGTHLVTRAALPIVAEGGGHGLIIDGIAETSALISAYAGSGPPALLAGPDPYALVLADPRRDALMLVRHGDGPPLHWAVHDGVVVAASEPAALLAAGVPADPDPEVMRRFLDEGRCDDGAATFFAHIRRVLPGQVIDVTRDAQGGTFTIRTHRVDHSAGQPPDVEQALTRSCEHGRIGVRLAPGYAAGAALGVALARVDRARPLPVYSTTMPELAVTEQASYGAAAVLGPLSRGAVRHRALPFFVDEIDVDAYLRDLGEPTPELDDWLLWALARRVAGDVDALIDPARVGAHLGRLADRTTARFGVGLRTPMRDLDADATTDHQLRDDLAALATRTLPAGCLPQRPADPTGDALLRGAVAQLRSELVTTFLHCPEALADTLDLLAGRRVDAGRLWRRYLLERWLRSHAPPGDQQRPDRRPGARRSGEPGAGWRRVPVRTEALEPADKIPEKIAWHIGEAASAMAGAGPWYVLLAAKPLAVMQGRARPLWQIHPGWAARALHRLARRTRLDGPWTMQVAIEQAGAWRMIVAVACVALGLTGWYDRLAGPHVRAIRGPRADAVPPAQVSVVPAPADPAGVAAEVVAALRTALPDALHAGFGGCAVVGDDVLALATRPGAAAGPDLDDWCADDLSGEHTPLLLVAEEVTAAG